ncbi:putative cysteine desulfurase [Diplonema papillatum]|nr:putative cysteine desulfurase [Diplonema papillatum]|eukprot:gene6736-10317_t
MAALPAQAGSYNVAAVVGMFPQAVFDKKSVYLDSAATTLKPKQVADAVDKFYRQQYATVHRGMYPAALRATDKYHATRRKVQAFVNARHTNEIIFTKGCTEAINLIARSLGDRFVKRNDEIIISESEHHSNIVPWQLLCQRSGARLRVAPINAKTGKIDLPAFQKLVNNRTKIVAIQHKSNVTGVTQPVQQIVAAAKTVGAKVVVDAAQSCTSPQLDVEKLGCDFLAFSGHKMFGPTGVGVLYGKRELLNEMPPYEGGGDMVDRVSFEKTTFAPIPQKFEAGTPQVASVIGLGAAIDFIEGIGRENLQKYVDEIGEYTREKLRGIKGVRLFPSESSIVTITTPDSPLDTATLLGASGFAVRAGHHCCQPLHHRLGASSSLRVSIAPHTTKQDIDKLVIALKVVMQQLSVRKDIEVSTPV